MAVKVAKYEPLYQAIMTDIFTGTPRTASCSIFPRGAEVCISAVIFLNIMDIFSLLSVRRSVFIERGHQQFPV
jgi:hypothetical protein